MKNKRVSFTKYLFRPSSVGYLMVEPKTKKLRELGELSNTAKEYLLDIYIEKVYGRVKDITNKYTMKGNYVEEDSLSLMQLHYGTKLLLKNKNQYQNKYMAGTPDIVTKDFVADAKSSWDIWTFFKADGNNKLYYWQLQSYMWLTGKKRADLCYCLNNTPTHMIVDEQMRMAYKHGVLDGTEEMDKISKMVETNMTFDDIPAEKRIKVFSYEYSKKDIARLRKKIILARKYLTSLSY